MTCTMTKEWFQLHNLIAELFHRHDVRLSFLNEVAENAEQ